MMSAPHCVESLETRELTVAAQRPAVLVLIYAAVQESPDSSKRTIRLTAPRSEVHLRPGCVVSAFFSSLGNEVSDGGAREIAAKTARLDP